jgi:hypothetical protein
MAAVGAHPVLYHHPAAGDDAFSMSSYFSHGGSTTSSPASSFSAALAPAPQQLLGPADPAAQFDISEFFDDVAQGVFAPPPAVVDAPPHVAAPADSGNAAAAAAGAGASAANAR